MANGIGDNDDDGAFIGCQTYQAYAACLRSYLKVCIHSIAVDTIERIVTVGH